MKIANAVLIPLVLAACSPAPGDSTGPEAAATPPSPYAFQVNLTLTQRAADKLAATKERVTVAAMYFGAPASEDAPGVDDHMMEVPLGEDLVEVDPVNAVVTAPGTGFDAQFLSSVKGDPEVLVNVYSARKTHENNLLSCGIYQGPVAMAQKKPVEIRCDLIYGEDGEPLPPPQ